MLHKVALEINSRCLDQIVYSAAQRRDSLGDADSAHALR